MHLPAIVFLHGIGPGASIVATMAVQRLHHVGLQQCAVIVPELPNLTYCLGLPLPLPTALTPRQTAAAIATAVEKAHENAAAAPKIQYHDSQETDNAGGPQEADSVSAGPGAIYIGQSFGTVVLTWLLRHQPQTVSAALLIDPVVFLIHHAALCYRFLYRPAVTGQQQLLRYFAADELHIQHYLRRHFEWHENALWLEDIPARLLEPQSANYLHYFKASSRSSGRSGTGENGKRCRVCVVVGEADSFIDAPSVIKYLTQGPWSSKVPNRNKADAVELADTVSRNVANDMLLPDLITIEGADHGGWAASGQVKDVVAWLLSLPELHKATQARVARPPQLDGASDRQ